MKKLLLISIIFFLTLGTKAQFAELGEEVAPTWVSSLNNFTNERIDSLSLKENVSRTIYYSSTGSDITGNGSIGNPYATPLKCAQTILPIAFGVTITISGAGIANFDITNALEMELAEKTFINSTLAFTGSTITTIENAFTVAKTGNRLFAYTLSKTGLTATLNQYRGNFVTNNANSEFYPIAYNAAGTNSFEMEFVHNSKTTMTKVVSYGVTWTDPGNIGYILDIGFKSNVNSYITFTNMNFTFGATTNCLLQYNDVPKSFTNCKFNMKSMEIGTSGSAKQLSIDFSRCSFEQNYEQTTFIYVYNLPGKVNFERCFFGSYLITGTASQGTIFPVKSMGISFSNGAYFYGPGNTAGKGVFCGWQGMSNISIARGIVVRDFLNFINVGDFLIINISNLSSGLLDVYFEFQNVANLLSGIPKPGQTLIIPNIYGSLPTNLVNGITSGYIFVNPKNDIHISVVGIYGEYESEIIANLADNSSGTISVGNITQNRSVFIDYSITRGTSVEQGTILMTNKTGTAIIDNDEFDDTGVTFSKSLVGNVITLGWTTTSTGAAATFNYSIRRIML